MLTLVLHAVVAVVLLAPEARPMSGVVLYTGRWAVGLGRMQPYVNNHVEHLIRPLALDVVVHGYDSQICGANTSRVRANELQTDVRGVFAASGHARGLQVEHFRRDPQTEKVNSSYTLYRGMSRMVRLDSWQRRYLASWRTQFGKLGRAFASPHSYSFVVRARLDVLFQEDAVLPRWPLPMDIAFALPGDRSRNPMKQVKFKDWLYAASVLVFTELVNTSSVYLNESVRFFGACPEEQVHAHLLARGMDFRPWNVNVRMAEGRKTWCRVRTPPTGSAARGKAQTADTTHSQQKRRISGGEPPAVRRN